MNIRFWGVRGSIAVSGGPFLRTGGHTTCVEVEAEGERLILDGGTGLAALGQELGTPTDATILFSHVHWDHIQGVPFFTPAFHPGSRLRLMGAPSEWGSLKDALESQMRPPTFPVGLDALQAQLEFVDMVPRRPLEVGPFRITAAEMSHPNGVLVYRIEAGGKTLVFATDVEHGSELDTRLLHFAEGADLLVHDAQYTTAEYLGEEGPARRGWGHSTWEQALQTGRLAGVRRLALCHHDPTRTDNQVAVIEAVAAQRFAGAFAAREGSRIQL